MKRYLKVLLPLLTAFGLLIANTIPAYAATTADVTITATPEYLALTVSDGATNTWAIGAIAESATAWYSDDSNTPSEPATDADGKFTITNTGSVASDIGIHSHNFTGGVGWTVGAAVGENTVKLGAFKTGDANKAAMAVISNGGVAYISDIAASAHTHGGLYIDTGTFTDGVEKSTTITYTITKHV